MYVLLGAAIAAVFANDGAALLLTPIVLAILLRLQFPPAAAMAFTIACGFIADTGSLPLVVSNLVNIVSADYFHLGFAEYAAVMIPVGIVSVLASLGMLLLYFGKSIPKRYDVLALTSPTAAITDRATFRAGWVVLALLQAFPDATVHTTLYDPEGTFPEFRDVDIRVSPLNRVGPLRRHHRAALPVLPFASSALRIDADLVIASSSGWAHGFPTTGRTLVYCHAPARWLYQSERYLGGDPRRSPTGLALLALRAPLRRCDRRAAARADAYLANSHVVRERIGEAYGIEAEVLPPPFAVDTTGEQEAVPDAADWGEGYHLVVSRLLPYKNVDQVVEAFRGLPERLLVIGGGYNYRETVSSWFRSLFTFNPAPELMANTPITFQIHNLVVIALIGIWPYTRLVHMFSAPVGYLVRPYVVYRSKDPVRGGRKYAKAWETPVLPR